MNIIQELLIVAFFSLLFGFATGYHASNLMHDAKTAKAVEVENADSNKKSTEFEKSLSAINTQYSLIDKKATYENSYNCIIPADGLQLLRAATK